MKTMKERLVDFLAYKKMSQGKFEQSLGLSRGFVSKVGDSIRANNLKRIEDKYPELNLPWLLTGEGSMLLAGDITQSGSGSQNNGSGTINNDNRRYYRGCGGADNKAAQDILDLGDRVTVLEDEKTGTISSVRTPGSVPFYGNLPVSAGQQDLATMLTSEKPTGWIDLPGMPISVGAFPVIGCSMEPDIRQGDFICIAEVDRWESIDPEKTYMIITDEDRMIKHLSVDENDNDILWCTSPNYTKFKIDKSQIRKVFRVTFSGRFR